MAKTKAIIFDSDGTLLNSFELFVGTYAYIAQKHGYPIPEATALRAKMAQSLPIHTIFAEFFPGGDMEELLGTNREYITNNLLNIQSYEGLHEMLTGLHNKGYKLGLFTGSDEGVIAMYKQHDLVHLFSSIVHIRRTTNHKPHPEGFLLAAKECGVLPEEAIMVGDSRNDIIAGKNGGCKAAFCITGVN